ncbi:hypothetical protein RclHR1_03520003 [Rhizophagus clarus]|uniref:Uncharacterized protein n=1 Tax=Rhizophagus clarus TaxID=94130 RepID=A0A2Z6RBB3_9GLOM|nr:hypothetical protein RclHR1_03520003 [Rhizophagus clarus]
MHVAGRNENLFYFTLFFIFYFIFHFSLHSFLRLHSFSITLVTVTGFISKQPFNTLPSLITMKSFKILVILFVITLVALISLTDAIPPPNDPKSCSTDLGCSLLTKRDEGNPNALPTGNASDPDIISPPSPNYNGNQLQRLAVPIGVICGVVIGSIILYLIWKWCFKSSGTT